VICWALYIVYTKRLSNQFAPTHFMVANFITAFFISCLIFFTTNISIPSTLVQLSHSSIQVLVSLLILGTANTILFFFLYQWCLKHISAFIVSSSSYLSPLATALIAIPFFGEQLSTTLLISAVSIFIGSYLILSEKK